MLTSRSSRRTRRSRRSRQATWLPIRAALGIGGLLLVGLAASPVDALTSATRSASDHVDLRTSPAGRPTPAGPTVDRPTADRTVASTSKSRLRWRFRFDTDYVLARPKVGPDGTVYVDDGSGHLYAINPDGTQQWVVNGVGGASVALGPDGTIYVGDTQTITAVNPDGTVKWTFHQDPISLILLGPGVGPDGNIYAVASSGLGVFSLTPEGTLRWALPESYQRAIEENQEIAFGPAPGHGSQLYFHANRHFEAVRLNGKMTFRVEGDGRGSCGDGAQPVVGPNGNAITTTWTIGEGAKLFSYRPEGKPDWSFVYQPNNCSSEPDVAPDGTVYIVWNTSRLFAVAPNGRPREVMVDDDLLNDPAVSPRGDQVVVTGSTYVEHAGLVQSFSPRDGSQLWSVPLPSEGGANQVPMSSTHPAFSPDGKTAYVTTIISGVYDHCYLYAVNTRR